MNKKYYWLKLHNNFFQQSAIKKLRSLENGSLYTLIYLKLQLLSITTDGNLFFKGVEDTFAADLSWEIDEQTEDIKKVLELLEKYYLLEIVDEDCLLLTKVAGVIGKESESTERVRRMRSKNSELALQCNGDVTKSNTEIELEKELEIKIELYPEKELKKELEKENDEAQTHVHAPVYLEDKNSLAVETVSSVSANNPATSDLSSATFTAKESPLPPDDSPEEDITLREIKLISNRLFVRMSSNKAQSLDQIPAVTYTEILPPENTFEDFCKYYPKAYDRASPFKAWEQTLALGIDPADLVCAAKKYTLKVKAEQILPCYITSSRNFLLNNKFWDYLPTYLVTCPNCKGKGVFAKVSLAGDTDYYTCNCHKRHQHLARPNLTLSASA